MDNNGSSAPVILPKQLAQAKLERVVSQYEKIIEEHSSTYKWLMASLLSINLGGLLAITQFEKITSLDKIAGAFLILGVLAALGTGWIGQLINQKAARKLSEQELFWRIAVLSKEFDVVEGEKLDRELSAISTIPARFASFSSVIGWLVGVVLIGIGLS